MSYIELVGAIIRSGLKQEGPDYLLTDGGRFWCSIGDLDPATVRKLAIDFQDPKSRHSTRGESAKEAA